MICGEDLYDTTFLGLDHLFGKKTDSYDSMKDNTPSFNAT